MTGYLEGLKSSLTVQVGLMLGSREAEKLPGLNNWAKSSEGTKKVEASYSELK